MRTRTVRLDDEAERDLEEIRRTTGMSVSAALKQGLKVLHEEVAQRVVSPTPYDIYAELDLGNGGYAVAPASHTRQAVREAIRRKLGR